MDSVNLAIVVVSSLCFSLLRTGRLHSIMISSLAMERDLIIHYTMDGEGKE